MTFERLRRADWLAFAAALTLLFVTAVDWYSTKQGEDARNTLDRVEGLPPVAEDREEAKESATALAEREEDNAWQASAAIDRLILILLLGTVGTAIAAAFLRAAGRRFEPPGTPSGIAAVGATVTAALVAYRIVQEPGLDAASTVKIGAPLAVLVLAVLAFASARGLQAEERGDPFNEVAEPEPEPEPAAE
jgi:hypothetical protein